MPMTSMSSLRSATICCRSIALRTLVRRSRRRAARSYSSSDAAARIWPSSRRTIVSVSPSRNSRSSSTRPVVGVVVDLADAGSGALLDVEQQAGPAEPLVPPELVVAAGAQGERAQQQVERLADGIGVAVRTEVAHALALPPPHHHGPGPLVAHGHGQERVALVVAQPDVEPRPVLLDEAVLEHERLDLVADLDPLDGLGGGHHRRGAGRHVAGVLEVVGQPLAQRARLADVDDTALAVLELVGAGGLGDRAGRRALHHDAEGRGCRDRPDPVTTTPLTPSVVTTMLREAVETGRRSLAGSGSR